MSKIALPVLLNLVWLATLPADEPLAERIRPLIQQHRGDVAVSIKHLDSGEAFEHNADQPMPTASLIKFPVMVEAYRQHHVGKMKLSQMLTLEEEDKVPGSGVLTDHFSPGMQLSLRDAIRLMIVYSDNTATNLVLDAIGLESTSESMENLGLPETKIHAKVFRRDASVFPERSSQFGLGSTTANETVRLYEKLEKRELIDEAASEQMLDHLLNCDDRRKLAAMLPAGTKIAHKGGAVARVRCDAGIIYSPSGAFVVCVLTNNNDDRSWRDDNAAHLLCARIARAAYDHFNPVGDGDVDQKPRELRIGASGELVEALQRTLNKVLRPSPLLDVDGDFGPITEAAVVRFQKEHKLNQNGVVDSSVWEQLGPLQMHDDPVPPPEIVNAEETEKVPADTIDGRPFVTCKAWVIGDAASGEALWGQEAETKLDIASTTKIMTAYLVLKLAEQDPEILQERITFSQRADDTPGSTSGLRAGEQVLVSELLYGLLLPSGNDASVALAEHFGSRFAVGGDADEKDSYAHFVDEMNRTADELEMEQTRYENPHGLTAEGHQATARDLLRLAHACMKLERFRQYVSTKQRGCVVESVSGYERNVKWTNTNQLLDIEGYLGVKTGTTRAAGACLVSCGRRGEEELIVVALGAQSSGARYVDTRNLFRWAWQQRGHMD